ncbi:hypothetical protein DRN84_01320 [Candidatus Geothermarchaeota archaeon]|nr:MAG: hypothetical protein DRN87_02835 [Candidatus Geothermarchaeota archaeon]RLG62666.1 MAG: hypothetical protein DRN84_01320 [Candidatus Geothermarchaeota archaeon]HEW93166.1 hypothetical protein [Thermoprotei archaeon]
MKLNLVGRVSLLIISIYTLSIGFIESTPLLGVLGLLGVIIAIFSIMGKFMDELFLLKYCISLSYIVSYIVLSVYSPTIEAALIKIILVILSFLAIFA